MALHLAKMKMQHADNELTVCNIKKEKRKKKKKRKHGHRGCCMMLYCKNFFTYASHRAWTPMSLWFTMLLALSSADMTSRGSLFFKELPPFTFHELKCNIKICMYNALQRSVTAKLNYIGAKAEICNIIVIAYNSCIYI